MTYTIDGELDEIPLPTPQLETGGPKRAIMRNNCLVSWGPFKRNISEFHLGFAFPAPALFCQRHFL